MQEKVNVGESVAVQVTRAFRVDWTLLIVVLFILAIIYFLYKRRGGKGMDYKKIAMAIIIGAVFAFVAFALNADSSRSVALGLLVIYFELRFGDLLCKDVMSKERRIKK